MHVGQACKDVLSFGEEPAATVRINLFSLWQKVALIHVFTVELLLLKLYHFGYKIIHL